ncbi:MAG: hypothetical protein F7B60_03575 [Desulfurococcales archaeon]|nr:hypothetical protein [Desulfurococcales archaeon]
MGLIEATSMAVRIIIGSSVFSLIGLGGNMGVILYHYKLSDRINASQSIIIILSLLIVLSILTVYLYSLYTANASSFYTMIASFIVASLGEYAYRDKTKRSFKKRLQKWEKKILG